MSQELLYTTAAVLRTPHAFSTRLGGVSRGHLASLNLGATRGDEPENVLENWRRLGAACGIPTERFAYSRQVHGANVRTVGPADAQPPYAGFDWEAADGLVTNTPGLPLVIFTADCAPLLMHDPRAGVIAAVHCGWRSTAADIEAVALEKMAALGARPADVCAAVGPCIGLCCFETGPEVPAAFSALLGGETQGLFAEKPDGKTMVDLKGVVARRLLQLGVRPENIEQSDACTMCSPERYWSHRYTKGLRGTQANIIVL